MEAFQEARDRAARKLQVADHMLTMTYPMVKDPKLLLNIAENLAESMESSMTSVLEYQRLFKLIPLFRNTYDSKIVSFQTKIIPRFKGLKKHADCMAELKNIVKSHKDASVEFARKNAFVIADDNYSMKKLTVENIKEYIQKARAFLEDIKPIVSKNEGIFT